jgi:hypothetical protein
MSDLWFISSLFFDLVPHPLPVQCREDGEFLITIPQCHREILYLNRPGSFLLRKCDGRRTILDVLKAYMVEFLRADRDTVAYEVVRALRRLELAAAIVLLPKDRALETGKATG